MNNKTEYGYGIDAIFFHRGSETKVSSLKETAVKAKEAGWGFIVRYEGTYSNTKSTILGWDIEIVSVEQAKKMFLNNKKILLDIDAISISEWPKKSIIVAVSFKNGSPFVFTMNGFNFKKVKFEDLIKEP